MGRPRKIEPLTADDIRNSFGLFTLAMSPEWGYTHFQQQIVAPILERVVVGDPEVERVAFIMPFGHSKSSIGTVRFIPFLFGHHPNRNYIVLCYGKDLAIRFGREIKQIMESQAYRELFPASQITKHSRAATEFETVSGGHFYACSFDSAVNGLRCHGMIVDDPHKSMEDLLSDTTMTRVRDNYTSVVTSRLEPDAFMLFNTTRWAPFDLIGWRMEQDGAWDYIKNIPYTRDDMSHDPNNSRKWKIVHLMAEAEVDEGWRSADCQCGKVNGKHGEPLWPEKWHCAALAKKKRDSTKWEASYQGKPTIGGGFWFVDHPPNFYEKIEPGDLKQMNIYMICDPALCRTKKSDRVAILVIATGSDENFYVIDGVIDRLNSDQRSDNFFRLHRKWRPIASGYEEFGLQTDILELKRRMEKENYRFPIIELGRKGEWHNFAKESRIETLRPQASAGRWYFPNPETPGRDVRTCEMIRRLVKEEWNRYPACDYDDGLDVMSRINDPAMRVTFPVVQKVDFTRYERSRGTTWMSM